MLKQTLFRSCVQRPYPYLAHRKGLVVRLLSVRPIVAWDGNVAKSIHPAYKPEDEKWKGKNVTDFVFQNLGKFDKSKLAIVCGTTGQKRTFGDLESDIDAVAVGLNELNTLKKGSTVALMSPNHVDYLAALHGSFKLGCVVSPFNPLYTEFEVAAQLEKCGAEVAIVHPDVLPVVEKALAKPGHNLKVKQVVSLDKEIQEWRQSHAGKKVIQDQQGGASDTTLLPYSSGTTGFPKGTMLSHDNLIVNILQMRPEFDNWDPDKDVLISPLPMFHIYGFLVSLHLPILTGVTYVTMKSFDLGRYCELVQDYKCTRTHIVPPITLALAKAPVVDDYDMSSLKIGLSAAAPLGAEICKEVKDRLGLKVKQAWGMSELSPVGTLVEDDQIDHVNPGSVGPPVPGTEVKVVDVTTEEALPSGQEGELWIRGPQVMKGYLDEPEKTKECLTDDGWFKTGDIAKIDEHGYVFITDRLKELIKYKGFQVAPAELEAVICTHPGVQDAAVIPREDERAGEVPRAYIVLKDLPEKPTEKDIQNYVAGRVADYKQLRGGVVFTEAIPKNASGKILRRNVVEMDKGRP